MFVLYVIDSCRKIVQRLLVGSKWSHFQPFQLILIGLSEKNQTGVEDILKNPCGNFRFVTLPLEIPEKRSFHPWKFCKIV